MQELKEVIEFIRKEQRDLLFLFIKEKLYILRSSRILWSSWVDISANNRMHPTAKGASSFGV